MAFFFFFFLLVAASKCGLAISKRRQQHVQHSEVATSHKYNSRCAPCHTVNDVAAHPSIHLMRCDAIGFTLNLLNSGDGSAQSTACRHQSNAANFLRQVVHHAAVSQTPRAPLQVLPWFRPTFFQGHQRSQPISSRHISSIFFFFKKFI